MRRCWRSVPTSSSRRSCNGQGGFTLIEVLLAVAILATISALVFASLSSSLKLIEMVRETASAEQIVRSTLRVIADELSVGYSTPSSPWLGLNGQQSGLPADTVVFFSTSQAWMSQAARETELVRVVYAREGNRLLRIARRNPYGMTDESVDQLELADKVIGFNVRYYDSLARVWVDEWDGRGGMKTQPKAVLIELTYQQGEGEPRTFREWVTVGGSQS